MNGSRPHLQCAILALAIALGGCTGSDGVAVPAGDRVAGAGGERGGNDLFGPYQVVPQWPKPLPDTRHSHEGWTWGSMGGVFAETPDRIWVAMRGELPLPPGVPAFTPWSMLNPSRGNAPATTDGLSATCEPVPLRGFERRWQHSIFILDAEGNLIDEWPHLEELFALEPCGRGPHKIKIGPYDPDRHVWIIDDQLHVIYKFTHDGQLVHTHGEVGVRGRGPNTFDRPTDIAWLPDGTYFIADGYGGTRVAKFDPQDNFLMDWGSPPADPRNPGPGEFNTPHSIAISADRRLFVIDRGHQRMQVFDENGTFLDMWSLREDHWPESINSLATEHVLTEDGYIWVGDAMLNRITKYDLDGNFLYSWGMSGGQPGQLGCPHQLSADRSGNLYVADCFQGRVQKFSPLPNADPAKLVGFTNPRWD